MRPIEHPTGIGELQRPDGTSVGMVTYDIDVSQEMLHVPPQAAPVPGMVHIAAYVEPLDSSFHLEALLGEDLVLVLQDGRRWAVFVDADGNAQARDTWPFRPGEKPL